MKMNGKIRSKPSPGMCGANDTMDLSGQDKVSKPIDLANEERRVLQEYSERELGDSEIEAVTRSFKELRMDSVSGKTDVWDAAASGRTSSCIVAVNESNNVYFGQIESFLSCRYKNNMVAKFAVINAYTCSYKMQESNGLWYTLYGQVTKKVVLFNSLSVPKITAPDEEDPTKFWILNC